MDGEEIVRLFFERNEKALAETEKKYRSYLMKIAKNITGSHEEAEECVNDTFLKAWETIPPNKPQNLAAFLGKLTRNLAITRLREYSAEKRGKGEIPLVYEELSDMVSGSLSIEQEHERKELMREISAFLRKQPEKKRNIFICRYWYCMSVRDISERFFMTESNVSVTLNRLRAKLRIYLWKRGYEI